RIPINLLDTTSTNKRTDKQLYNVALYSPTTLNVLFAMLRERLLTHYSHLRRYKPSYRVFRAGDVRHSQADISKARRMVGYAPTHNVEQGLDAALEWYRKNLA